MKLTRIKGLCERLFPDLARRCRDYYAADRALQLNSIEEYRAGVTEETPEYLKLNRAVWVAERRVPWWARTVITFKVAHDIRYWPAMQEARQERVQRLAELRRDWGQ